MNRPGQPDERAQDPGTSPVKGGRHRRPRARAGGLAPIPFRQELTPVTFLERAGVVHAGRVAVIDGDVSYTWAQFRSRSRRLASALRKASIRAGERVGWLAFNSEPLLLAHYGVPQAGAAIVAINTRFSASEIAYVIEHSSCRLIFHSPGLASQLEQVPDTIPRIALGSQFEEFLALGSDDEVASWLRHEDDLIAIDYTSGTTGRPKGVMYHHRGAFLNAIGMVVEDRLDSQSTYLWTLPMFHCNGWSHTWAMAAAGVTSVCVPRIDPPLIWQLLEEHRITHLNAAPTVLIMLANDAAAHRLEHPVRVCAGGAPPSPTLIAQMESFNIELVHLYGLTETYGPLTINVPPSHPLAPAEQAQYKARQGFAHLLAGEVKVVDEHMDELPNDGLSMGEVVARGNTLMTGYFREPQATSRAFRGGWLHTGDVGVTHPDGSIELRDRIKDMVVSGGENISTIELEQAVMSHPAVMEAAVIAIPDPKWGEVPKAFVVLRPGCSASADDIVAHVRTRLAGFKVPKVIEFAELPKTSTGKIQKYVLRERERERHPPPDE